MGYPWLDTKQGTLELRFADETGEKLANDAKTAGQWKDLDVLLSPANASIAMLDEIANKAVDLRDDPGADAIWKTEPDQLNGRVVITMSRADHDLIKRLADRFGKDLIEVRIADAPRISSQNRDTDIPPYWGGAKVLAPYGTCTTGFAWTVAGKSAMLTAAHCARDGGSISYPTQNNVGFVTASAEENWDGTYGTRYYSGQNVFRGDVALIRYYTATSAAKICVGGPGTNIALPVTQMAFRRRQPGASALDANADRVRARIRCG